MNMTINKQISNKTYTSTDLSLVGYISLFSPILSVDKTNPKKVSFSFSKDSEVEKLLDLFWSGQARVEPNDYFNQLKQIKSRIYSQK
ncbi:hypothetical protein A2Z33_06275 [Candidatus Gottesmanbacteria bacterium RBG_16_52_11]|uniref:DUF5659 domain-containing protein n=1 Tax=Candidatus Gottesmanbacteria bacterium RBG_16_52_11 TaxID=1798374 RepID=A0A1F5YXF0_9BACT|nr:MAG: hypothetical protein A2Z33_06275 [Candidatus Gottesmanbacteria bacterium RBG_16_52_11]